MAEIESRIFGNPKTSVMGVLLCIIDGVGSAATARSIVWASWDRNCCFAGKRAGNGTAGIVSERLGKFRIERQVQNRSLAEKLGAAVHI